MIVKKEKVASQEVVVHDDGESVYSMFYSLASRLNSYMYSNGTSLNVALLMANHLAWCILA